MEPKMTDFQIVYSPESVESLEQIAEYLAEQSEEAPFIVLSRIRDKIERLKTHPRLGEILPARPRLRRVVVGSYLIFYEVADERRQVRVADIIHAARQNEIERIRGDCALGSDPLA
jgi:plasmid stabilization system protein ParE